MWWSRLLAWLLLVASFHWTNSQDQTTFADATGKTIWQLAYYSTSANPTTCVPKMNSGWKVLSITQVPGAAIFGTAMATISVSETMKIVYIHFRGPDAITTFIFSGYTYLLQSTYVVQDFEGYSVAQEFATTFTALWQGGVKAGINNAWDEYCDFTLYISGHSVGSCMAQMFAVKMQKFGYWAYNNINLYAFSSPRCGYQPFAMAVNNAAIARYQVRVTDYVIQLPATSCTTLNTAAPSPCFWHAGYAVQYTKSLFGVWSTSPSRCATGETSTCLAGSILSIANHNGFYSLTYGVSPPTC